MRRDLDSTWTLAMGHETAYSRDNKDINIDMMVRNIAHLPYSP